MAQFAFTFDETRAQLIRATRRLGIIVIHLGIILDGGTIRLYWSRDENCSRQRHSTVNVTEMGMEMRWGWECDSGGNENEMGMNGLPWFACRVSISTDESIMTNAE